MGLSSTCEQKIADSNFFFNDSHRPEVELKRDIINTGLFSVGLKPNGRHDRETIEARCKYRKAPGK